MKRFAVPCLWAALAGGAAFAGPVPETKDLLRRAGQAVERFWEQFPAVNCTEAVSQTLEKDGKTAFRREASFDYLVTMKMAGDEMSVEESRLEAKPGGKPKPAPLLVTNGFSTLLLVFHPFYQGSFEYSQPQEQEWLGRKALRMEFRQVRGARSPSALRLKGRDYPLEWRGAAWIDPDSGAVLKIEAELGSAMEDLGLRALTAEVVYAPRRFAGSSEDYWVPATATIEALSPRQRWRNIHRFSNYRRFTVETKESLGSPK